MQSFVHLLITVASVTLAVAANTNNASLLMTVQHYYPYIADIYFFSAPICLFLTR